MERNTTNPSLDYFEYNLEDDESTCKSCTRKLLTGKHGTNMEKLLKSYHPEIFEKIVKTKSQREVNKSQNLSKRQGEKTAKNS